MLRAIALGVAGSHWDPQHRIRYDDFYARVDLADERLRLVLEADSFEFHGERAAMSRDAERYDELVSRGWLVLRFTWEQVMLRPAWVARVIERTVRRRIAELGADEGRLTHLSTLGRGGLSTPDRARSAKRSQPSLPTRPKTAVCRPADSAGRHTGSGRRGLRRRLRTPSRRCRGPR